MKLEVQISFGHDCLEQWSQSVAQVFQTLLSSVVCDHHLGYHCVGFQEIGQGLDL